jgi:PKHD-type hydroxylase
MALLLNNPEDFEGGEFQVKADSDVSKNLELKKGRAWFFPSWVLHRVAPVTKGVRKSLVVWAGGPSFK